MFTLECNYFWDSYIRLCHEAHYEHYFLYLILYFSHFIFLNVPSLKLIETVIRIFMSFRLYYLIHFYASLFLFAPFTVILSFHIVGQFIFATSSCESMHLSWRRNTSTLSRFVFLPMQWQDFRTWAVKPLTATFYSKERKTFQKKIAFWCRLGNYLQFLPGWLPLPFFGDSPFLLKIEFFNLPWEFFYRIIFI